MRRPCKRCGHPLEPPQICPKCKLWARSIAFPRPRTTSRATHVAGYVPPRGSIAWTFLGVVR